MRLVVATSNRGKLREFRDLLSDMHVELVGLDDLAPLSEPEETGATFEENARLKAVYYSARVPGLVIAEDSGLEIDALDGWPGVRTARVPGATYQEKWDEVYRRLDARGSRESRARFVCCVALAEDGAVRFAARGTVEGRIAPMPRGTGGFGYDPIFYYPPLAATLAEIPEAEKGLVSHRGHAVRQLRALLDTSLSA